MTDQDVPRFETKIAVIVHRDLPIWQKLNMTAFLASGVAAAHPDALGADYVDADGTKYGPMFGQPTLVFAADDAELRRSLDRALTRDVTPVIFTRDLFGTRHDEANRAAVAALARADLDLVGLALRADRRDVDKITKGLLLHA